VALPGCLFRQSDTTRAAGSYRAIPDPNRSWATHFTLTESLPVPNYRANGLRFLWGLIRSKFTCAWLVASIKVRAPPATAPSRVSFGPHMCMIRG
jgi:hypothetical protein